MVVLIILVVVTMVALGLLLTIINAAGRSRPLDAAARGVDDALNDLASSEVGVGAVRDVVKFIGGAVLFVVASAVGVGMANAPEPVRVVAIAFFVGAGWWWRARISVVLQAVLGD